MANYRTQEENYLNSLVYQGDNVDAENFLRSPYANIILEQPLRAPMQLDANMGDIPYYIEEQIQTLQEIDSLVVKEIKRRSSLNWRIILFIVRLKARRPRRRFVYFENMQTSQRLYTINCSTRQGLITKLFDQGIVPMTPSMYNLLLNAQISTGPLGILRRNTMGGDYIPKHWHTIYIRFVHVETPPNTSLEQMFAQLRC
jgi:hypothetical protein